MGTLLDPGQHYIPCPRFGGARPAYACCVQDRYRVCRKSCQPLADHVKENPDLPKQSIELYKKRARQKDGELFRLMSSRSAGKGILDADLTCKWCGFRAKSERGLKVHNKRRHRGREL